MRSPFYLIVPLALAACDGTTPIAAPTGTSAPAQPVGGQPGGEVERLACALGKGSPFSTTCIVERQQDTGGALLTIRHPDGGFRRLRIATDGRGVIAADGAEASTVRVIGKNEIEVSIGQDRYRLPATVRGKGAK